MDGCRLPVELALKMLAEDSMGFAARVGELK
jgi:hypothetical protein